MYKTLRIAILLFCFIFLCLYIFIFHQTLTVSPVCRDNRSARIITIFPLIQSINQSLHAHIFFILITTFINYTFTILYLLRGNHNLLLKRSLKFATKVFMLSIFIFSSFFLFSKKLPIVVLLLSTHSSLIIGGSPLLLSYGGSPPASPASHLAGMLRWRDPSTNPGPTAWCVCVRN